MRRWLVWLVDGGVVADKKWFFTEWGANRYCRSVRGDGRYATVLAPPELWRKEHD